MKFKTILRVFVVFFLLIAGFHAQLQALASTASSFDPTKIEFRLMASGLTQPLFITNAGDGSGRLFIIERAGRILILKDGSLLSSPFLDIRSLVNSTGSEQGLLALSFHPSYDTNGQFYTVHTGSNGSLILSRFTRSSANPDLADSGSRTTLLTISHPTYQNHNGGTLAFGPDGYLYWSTGDGGSGGDPSNNAQNLNSLLGKILRLDVDSGSPYSIPASNPFFDNPNPSIRKEIWAYGLRNPWRFSFDRQTGDMYIGDVGQRAHEEIDFQPSNDPGGRNYGWRVMEGSFCYNPASGCDRSGKVLPIAEYDHSVGCSITGGYVYRGSQYPALQGYYFYGDFCTGVLFSLRNNPPNGWTVMQVADTPYSISSFGEDENGKLYLVDYAGGRIYQIHYNVDSLVPGDITAFAATTGDSNGSVILSWIAPPDDAGDSSSGPVTSYRVRYSTSSISSETDWNNANVVGNGLPTPVAPGATQTMIVSGLKPNTLYNFAIRAQDEQSNQSANFVTASTTTKVAVPMPPGVYDDGNSAWSYSNGFRIQTAAPAYEGGIRYTTTMNEAAVFTFSGSQVTLLYTGNTNRGQVDVYLDDNSAKIATVDQYTSTVTYQKKWTSGDLGPGEHTLQFIHAGPAGRVVNIDALIVGDYVPPPGMGTHDDLHTGWTFSSGFTRYESTSAYDGGIRYATAVGQFAEFTFTGSQVTLLYTGNTNRGLVDVYLDGSAPSNKIATINQYTSSVSYQKGWTSGNLGAGEHTIKFVHAGAAGKVVNIDALTVDTYTPPSEGIFDDNTLLYSPGFSTQTVTDAYGGGIHYTTTADAYVEFSFTGSYFVLVYTANINRGDVEVWEGATQLGTIPQYSATRVAQKKWMSDDLGAGEHTIRLKHPATGSAIMDIDAIMIPVASGTFDDTHANWLYSSGFSTQVVADAYDGGIHYSTTVGKTAEFAFVGSEFTLLYTGNINRALLDVYVDGVRVATIDESNPTRQVQMTWNSGPLPGGAGGHLVRLVHASGAVMDVDAIQIVSP